MNDPILITFKGVSTSLGLWVVAIGLLPCPATAEEIPKPPNIILILSDDQGYGDLSCYEHSEELRTPNIDRLAKNGVRLTDGYASAPICGPTRAGLLSGRYQQRFGVYTNRHIFDDGFLQQETLAEVLKGLGYTTGVVGKWHLGRMTEERRPNRRGFDEFYGFLKSMRGYAGRNPNNPIYRNREPVGAEEGYLTDSFNRAAVDFVERHAKDGPFFLYLSYNAPHYPMEAREDILKRFDTGDAMRDVYLAMMASVDEGVGMVLNSLEKHDIDGNTLVFYLSDNGGLTTKGADNGVLRDDKGSVYEGGIRVPFLVSWPDQLPAGHVCTVPVTSLDVFPTAVAAAGGTLPEDRTSDGRDMLPVLMKDGEGPLHQTLFWHSQSVDSDRWAVRHGDWKLVSGEELYDLKEDIGESKDLAAEKPEIVKKLQGLFDEWSSSVQADARAVSAASE